jgi:hypothetical protein
MARAAVAAAPNRPAYGKRLRPGRQQLILVAIVIAGIWTVAAFAGAINQLSLVSVRHAELTDETGTLDSRVNAGTQELLLVQTDGYQALAARSYGLGRPGEVIFSLGEAAPSPDPVAQLGTSAESARDAKPLDAWLGLLFGD